MLQVFASWDEVREKALRLRHSGAVVMDYHDEQQDAASVAGDNGSYVVRLYRDPEGNVLTWSCSCPWGYWAWRRRYEYRGRVCSHGLATFYESRALGEGYYQEVTYQESPGSLGYEEGT